MRPLDECNLLSLDTHCKDSQQQQKDDPATSQTVPVFRPQ